LEAKLKSVEKFDECVGALLNLISNLGIVGYEDVRVGALEKTYVKENSYSSTDCFL
jgi:hypothetical protein